MKVVKGDKMVSHFPREFCRIAWYFLGRLKCRNDVADDIVSSCVEEWQLHCSNKEQTKCMKELLNLYLRKVFSSICDNNKPVYTLLNQWSRVYATPAIFDPKKVRLIHKSLR